MTPKQKSSKEYSTVSIRFPRWLYEWLTNTAQKEGRSYNQQVVHMLTQIFNEKYPDGVKRDND